MKRTPFFILFIHLLFMPLLSTIPFTVAAEAKQENHLSLVELYTSQGCSSCPPADALLEHYAKRPDVIALTFAVDYWDYLGWKDTFGSAANSRRQQQYAALRGDGSVYTPQAVINGLHHANGSSKYKIDNFLTISKKKIARQSVPLKLYRQNNRIVIETGASQSASKQEATLWLALVKDKGEVNILRGENHGRKLTYFNIVKSLKSLTIWNGTAQKIAVKQDDMVLGKNEHCVAFLQDKSTGAILNAAKLR